MDLSKILIFIYLLLCLSSLLCPLPPFLPLVFPFFNFLSTNSLLYITFAVPSDTSHFIPFSHPFLLLHSFPFSFPFLAPFFFFICLPLSVTHSAQVNHSSIESFKPSMGKRNSRRVQITRPLPLPPRPATSFCTLICSSFSLCVKKC